MFKGLFYLDSEQITGLLIGLALGIPLTGIVVLAAFII